MVLIHLKSQYVSLIITLLSGAAELCLFGATLGANKYIECNALKRGGQVSVRRHCSRTKFLAVLAMVVFIVLELIASFFSDPAFSLEPDPRPCVAIDRYDVRSDSIFNVSSESIIISCIRVDGDQFFQHIGNRSLLDKEVRCDESYLYKYVGEGIIVETIGVNQTQTCVDGFGCVYTEVRGQEFLISGVIVEEEIDVITQVEYLVTILSKDFDIGKNQESVLGQRGLGAYIEFVTEPLELRRRILTGSETTTCPFFLSKDATEVPLGLICAIVITWVLSFLTFVLTLFLKRSLFYDMGDPLHWAQRTFRHIDDPITGNPVVTSVYEHGERHMYVSSSSSEEDSFLKILATKLGSRFRRRNREMAEGSVHEQLSL